MPQQSNFTLIFYVILFAAILTTFLRQDKIDTASNTNTEYASKLTAASHSAMQVVDTNKMTMGKAIWDTKESREKSLEAFYMALGENLWLEADPDMLKTIVPVVLLIDEDGYYINYNILFDDSNLPSGMTKAQYLQSAAGKDYLIKGINQVGAINTWAENRNGWAVQYTLGDYVRIVTPDGHKYEGERHQVAKDIREKETGGSATSVAAYLEESATGNPASGKFPEHKEQFIISEINKTMQHFINEFNYYSAEEKGKQGGYTKERFIINMPKVRSEDWHRMLENPTILSFVQGDNENIGSERLATYAYAGGELVKTDRYFITTKKVGSKTYMIYHSVRECLKSGTESITPTGTAGYTYTGDGATYNIGKFYNTMADAALQGAVPCPDCIK